MSSCARDKVVRHILDVRDEQSFLAGHLPGAYNLPWAEMDTQGFQLPTRSTPMLVCCHGGPSPDGTHFPCIRRAYSDQNNLLVPSRAWVRRLVILDDCFDANLCLAFTVGRAC